jgi:nucleoside-diphosphate-sugar epimerase
LVFLRCVVAVGAGYVGKILINKLLKEANTEKIFVIDKDYLNFGNPKIVFIHKNLVDNWEEDIEVQNNTQVIHLAWQIRTMYGRSKLQWHWNIDGSKKVFEFVRRHSDKIRTFIHFSTVASYGAFKDNTFQKYFVEEEKFRSTDYLYAEEKRIAEEEMDKILGGAATTRPANTNLFVIRPASITGPVGRERSGFGLQSALAGKVSSKNFLENFIFSIVKKILQFMPATSGWARQFVFEDDIVNAVVCMCNTARRFDKIQKYNLCPENSYIDAKEMAVFLNKKPIYFHPRLVQVLCFFAWHITFGRIPTSAGVWKAYSYPILVNGQKILKDFPEFSYSKDIRKAYLNN